MGKHWKADRLCTNLCVGYLLVQQHTGAVELLRVGIARFGRKCRCTFSFHEDPEICRFPALDEVIPAIQGCHPLVQHVIPMESS